MCSARGQHLPQGVAAHARQDAEPGRATVTLDEQPNHRAAVLLTPETIRAEASVAPSCCWPTGSSPTPIIPTRQRARAAATGPAARYRGSASRRDGRAERQRALLPLRPTPAGQGPDRGPGGCRRRPHANLRVLPLTLRRETMHHANLEKLKRLFGMAAGAGWVGRPARLR